MGVGVTALVWRCTTCTVSIREHPTISGLSISRPKAVWKAEMPSAPVNTQHMFLVPLLICAVSWVQPDA
jgi:hypothetical protein